jgi:hypothetical protein
MSAQLALDQGWTTPPRPKVERPAHTPLLCASCQAKEARYGFRPHEDDPMLDRPRTLCFECFRVEIRRRQEAVQMVQVRLPLEQTLEALSLRRRRAQIAARHALDVRVEVSSGTLRSEM